MDTIASSRYTGLCELPKNFLDTHIDTAHPEIPRQWNNGERTYYRVKGPMCSDFVLNQGLYVNGDGKGDFLATVQRIDTDGSVILRLVTDYRLEKNNVAGVVARNIEQVFMLNAMLDKDIDVVVVLGPAGTGKTYCALAAMRHLVSSSISPIKRGFVCRTLVPMGEDVGFLPGNEFEKMDPWMGAVNDNMKAIQKLSSSARMSRSERRHAAKSSRVVRQNPHDDILEYVNIAKVQGRSLPDCIIMTDELQNITEMQLYMLVTRAAEGTKVFLLGDPNMSGQLDKVKRTGLARAENAFKGWEHAAVIRPCACERSRLAEFGNKYLIPS